MVNRSAPAPPTPLSSARPRGGPFTRWPRASDAVLAVVVFLVTVFVTTKEPNDDLVLRSVGDVPVAGFFLLAGACAALYWRRSQPVIVFGVTWVATAVSTGVSSVELVGIAMLVALYSVGRYAASDRWSYIGLGGAFAVAGLTVLIDEVTAETGPGTAERIAEVAFGLFLIFLVWYIGRRIRFRGERAAQREREQAAEARRVVAEERTRIARELHDVVAHRVSLMTVQAGAAKTVAADDLEGALRAMDAVEQTGRQALDELRHLLGVLRPETEVAGLGPQPGLADVPRLVEQFEAAGLKVSLTMNGVRTDLPARVDLSTYRIVQEALTNVLKHAGPTARTEVRLRTESQEVVIEVLDDGQGATILPGSGHGIGGMRERAMLLRGSLDAGPRPGGGFQVVARLPIGEEPT
jgi:signal transduction histidine kinase